MSNVEETIARIYTINFSKAWLTPKHRRTDRVVNMIKEFAIKHLKSSQIKIDQDLNRYIWQKGKTNPPRKVRVRIVKDEDDQVIVSLYEDVINESISASSIKEDSTDLNTEPLNTNDNSPTKDIDKDNNTKLKESKTKLKESKTKLKESKTK